MHSAAARREQDILALWDRAAGRARRQRDDALFAAAGAAPTDRSAPAMPRCSPCARDCSARRGGCAPPAPPVTPTASSSADSAVLADGLAPPADATPPRIAIGRQRADAASADAVRSRRTRRGLRFCAPRPGYCSRAASAWRRRPRLIRTHSTRSRPSSNACDPGAVLSVRARLSRLRPRLAGRDRYRAGALGRSAGRRRA